MFPSEDDKKNFEGMVPVFAKWRNRLSVRGDKLIKKRTMEHMLWVHTCQIYLIRVSFVHQAFLLASKHGEI